MLNEFIEKVIATWRATISRQFTPNSYPLRERERNTSTSNLEHIRSGDYFIPNLTLREPPQTSTGRYGRMRKTYLQEHRPALYSHLLLSEKLYAHLLEIDQAANERLAQLMPQMVKAAGITEQLKTTNQMRWVGLMNTVKAQVEEFILTELIFD